MSTSSNKGSSPRPPAHRRGPAPPGGTSPARRQAAAILEVLAGIRRPTEAAQVLGTSLPRYYQLERRALNGLVAACEPAPRGPRVDPARRLLALERENKRLGRECDRQRALVRMAERSLGLAPPSPKPTPGGKQEATGGNVKRRRRRASVRALQVVRGLRADEVSETTENGAAEDMTVDSSSPQETRA